MPDEEYEGYDLSEMTEEQKDQAIMSLAEAYNEQLDLSITLSNAMAILATQLMQGDKMGERRETIRLTAIKMAALNQYAAAMMGVDFRQAEMDARFEDIVQGLDLEGE